jgi:hypothetical protein
MTGVGYFHLRVFYELPSIERRLQALAGFMQRLAALVPRPRLHLIRFHGVLAPNAKLRPQIIPSGPINATDNLPGHGETPHPSVPVRLSWAWLGHANVSTTRLYDRRKMRPEDSPTFKVAY